ncbi:MAG: TonB-dependent receptor, partial [Sulfurimonas sp.]|nr:TonB-dependent receptor [Sulfurimonas sp.]
MSHFFSLILISTLLLSNDIPNFEDDFLQSLEEVSEIATKSKLNIDDAPAFVTVLNYEKLRKLGIDNIQEALAQVPGVQLKREASGVPVIIFRGVSQKGEVKLMLDGVTINNTYRGSIFHFLDFPIELVERIEVIRGAGSVLYGSGAISGVINIITKSSNNSSSTLFVSGATHDNYKGGAIVSLNIDDVKIALDTYYEKDQKFIDSTDRHLKDYSVGVKINNEHFALLARIKKSDVGNAYGALSVPDSKTDKYNNVNDTLFTQLTYKNSLTNKSDIKILAGYKQYGQEIQGRYSTFGDIQTRYKEDAYYAQIDFYSKIISYNEFLIGAKYETAKVTQSEWIWESTIPSLPKYNVTPDSNRDTTSLYINDKYSINPDFDITAGIRYDNYSDFGDALSPTLAFVYRINPKWRIKSLYSQAYRVPSWVELTSNPNLKAETSNSYEVGVIYKDRKSSVVRFNIYRTEIHNLITKNTTYTQALDDSHFFGAELEYLFTPSQDLDLTLFASYV